MPLYIVHTGIVFTSVSLLYFSPTWFGLQTLHSVCVCCTYPNVQDRASQIAAIENSFEQAKQPVSCCTSEAGCLLEGGRGRGREERGREKGREERGRGREERGRGREERGREERRRGREGEGREGLLCEKRFPPPPRSPSTTANQEWLRKRCCQCSPTLRCAD